MIAPMLSTAIGLALALLLAPRTQTTPSAPIVMPPGEQLRGMTDLDGDGRDEAVTVDKDLGVVRIYTESERGFTLGFESVFAGELASAQVVDADGDGREEVVAFSLIGTLAVIDAGAPGRFEEQRMRGAYPAGPLCVAAPMIYLGAATFPSRVFRFEVDGAGVWQPREPLEARGGDVSVACGGDVDGDGRAETVVADNHYWAGVSRLYVFEGDRQERFEPRVDGTPHSARDVDGDGRDEVIMRFATTGPYALDLVTGARTPLPAATLGAPAPPLASGEPTLLP